MKLINGWFITITINTTTPHILNVLVDLFKLIPPN